MQVAETWKIFPSSLTRRDLQKSGKYFNLILATILETSTFSVSLHFSPVLTLHKLNPERSSIIKDSILNFQFLKLIIKMVPNIINHYPVWKLLLMVFSSIRLRSAPQLNLKLKLHYLLDLLPQCWVCLQKVDHMDTGGTFLSWGWIVWSVWRHLIYYTLVSYKLNICAHKIMHCEETNYIFEQKWIQTACLRCLFHSVNWWTMSILSQYNL